MKRDLSQAQFEHRAAKAGFKKEGFMGYWQLSDGRTSVSVLNAGKRWRDRWNYLLREDRKNRERETVSAHSVLNGSESVFASSKPNSLETA